MNLLSRAIKSRHFQLYHHLSRNTLFSPRPITPFQQSSLYCTTNLQSNITELSAQPPSPSPSPPPSSSGVNEAAEALPILPKPTEISYQAKIANFVSLIGHIHLPVQLHATPDGKILSTTFIAQQNGNISPYLSSMAFRDVIIPVVFEGELARIVACYVKETDCVYVTGKLCVDPLPFVVSETQGKFHILGEKINFVHGLEQKLSGRTGKDFGFVVDAASRFSNAGKIKDEDFWMDLVRNPKDWWDNREHKSIAFFNAKYPDFRHKTNGVGLWLDAAPQWVLTGIQGLEFAFYKCQPAKGGKEEEDYWKSLLENPEKWWDNRVSKNKMNKGSPDFRHKETKTPLWLDKAPDWVLQRLPPPVENSAHVV